MYLPSGTRTDAHEPPASDRHGGAASTPQHQARRRRRPRFPSSSDLHYGPKKIPNEDEATPTDRNHPFQSENWDGRPQCVPNCRSSRAQIVDGISSRHSTARHGYSTIGGRTIYGRTFRVEKDLKKKVLLSRWMDGWMDGWMNDSSSVVPPPPPRRNQDFNQTLFSCFSRSPLAPSRRSSNLSHAHTSPPRIAQGGHGRAARPSCYIS
jgi:hypothetical protein